MTQSVVDELVAILIAILLSLLPAETPDTATPSVGSDIASYAMQYQGSPYRYAGTDPSGFDCSGFTYYVVMNVTGMNIGTSTDVQASQGYDVAWDTWQPGDLLFFVGTGESGYYTHVGIYIGDGHFIHAQNESTGVVVSSIYSEYYSAHYAMAKRIV